MLNQIRKPAATPDCKKFRAPTLQQIKDKALPEEWLSIRNNSLAVITWADLLLARKLDCVNCPHYRFGVLGVVGGAERCAINARDGKRVIYDVEY